ncbi:restriction endonuclease subunit S [Capnocytophaga sp. oral taxon 326]|uniref:restriction endonuclease subunit S n=1 Tax=Capnocytophaga sp. oral taxon 326 TaxID=712212 RepID=UPI0002A28241|nr:restriction endonuclease subunit S [Capnocytophaga sp. oral taxon 326]EKY13411.1 type I restriction modification DNA specificity domain protein [Capnocytophaga sp. oral taxon 326 str. F0382]
MKKFKLSENIDPNKVFIINRSELEGRLDINFNSFSIRKIVERIKSKGALKLIDITEPIKNGSTPSDGKFENSGVTYYRSQDFTLYSFSKNQYISEIFNSKIIRSYIKKGDILLAVVGATLGKVGYVYSEELEGNINQNIARIRINDERFLSEFVAIYLDSNIGQKLIQRYTTITTQAYLNNQQLGKIPIPLLKIEVQQNIINILKSAYLKKQQKEAEAQRLLDSIDDYLLGELGITLPKEEEYLPQNTDKNSSYNLDNDNPLVKKGRLFLTNLSEVTGKRIDPDYYSIYYKKIMTKVEKGKYPMDTISNNCINVFSGKTPSSSEYSKDNTLYPIIKVSSYTDYKIDVEKAAFSVNKQPFSILKGDMFILSAAHQAEYVGKHIKYLEETPECSTSFVGELLCIRVNQEKLLSNYLFPLLNTKYYKILINREKTGQTSHIYPKDVESIKIPLPPLQKQNEIAAHISQIRNKANALKQEGKEILEQAKQEVEQMILGN